MFPPPSHDYRNAMYVREVFLVAISPLSKYQAEFQSTGTSFSETLKFCDFTLRSAFNAAPRALQHRASTQAPPPTVSATLCTSVKEEPMKDSKTKRSR